MYCLRLLARDLEVLGEAERRDPVDDPEVDHLRDRALRRGQLGRLDAEHLGRGRRVDVLAALERLAQLRLAGDVREDPQLDLRVVGREQLVPRLGDERGADLAAELGADRDRLQVRVRRREAAGRGDGLVDRRVQAPVLGDQARQRAEVRVQELRVLAPLLDHADDLVLAADRAQDARVGRVAGLALAAGREAELLEQDPADLLRRAEHELLARELVRPRLELLDPLAQPRGDLAHAVRVDLDAGVLHRGEHRRERELDVAVERLHVRARATRSSSRSRSRSVAAALRTSAAVSSSAAGSGSSSTPYSAARSSSGYSGRDGSIRYAGSSVSSIAVDALRLGVVDDQLGRSSALGRGETTTPLRIGDRDPILVGARSPPPASL